MQRVKIPSANLDFGSFKAAIRFLTVMMVVCCTDFLQICYEAYNKWILSILVTLKPRAVAFYFLI